MSENHLNRGHVREYDTSLELGFVMDGELNMQLPFYFRDGRFLTPPYVDGTPSFTTETSIIEEGSRIWLHEPRVGDELAYRLVGRGALARVSRWTYASYLDRMQLHTEKPS